MPVINRIAAYGDEMKTWRRHLHQNPELQFECFETANFVAARLREFGITEIHEGIATTGIVAIVEGQGSGPTIGLRADMDALPMTETTGLDYASKVEGKMHACGHDGHTTMLLGAAKYLAETRNFMGRVALIFQPAEEGGGGAEVMVQEGIMDRFDISDVFALHTQPGLDEGTFLTTTGPILAAADSFVVTVTGAGGHGAYPNQCVDPIPPAMAMAQGFGTIVSRNRAGTDDLVISVTQMHSGTTDNVIPDEAMIGGTVRTFSKETQKMVVERMQAIVDGHAAAYGVSAKLDFEFGYPPTINDPEKSAFAVSVAKSVSGDNGAIGDGAPDMGAEDFSYMLEQRPGAYLYLGQGPAAALHNTDFDFNDEVSAVGASFFARLVETAQPV